MTRARELADGAGKAQGDRNLLINGGMNIWERATSASVSTDTYSTVDRWKTRVGNQGAFTVSRSTDVPSAQGFTYSTKWDCTTADASPAAGDFIVFEQRIEGQNLQHLLKGTSSAKALTFSFWIKTNKTGTYVCELLDYDNSRNISKSFTISSSSTWEKITLTYDGDTTGTLDNNNGFSFAVMIWLGAGSNFTTGTLQTSWGTVGTDRATGVVNLADSTSNELYITGCQLEIGEKATDFEFESYKKTLDKCLRYYYWVGTVAKEGPGGLQRDGGWGTLCMRYNLSFPVPMRVAPVANHGNFTLNRRNGGYSSVMYWTGATNTNTKNNIWPFSNTRAYAQWGQYNNRGAGEAMQGSYPDVNFDAEL